MTRREMPSDGAEPFRRRRFLQAMAATSALAVAGCLSDDDSETDDTPDENATRDDGPDDADSTTPEEMETLAREFVELLDGGEFEAAEERVTEAARAELDRTTLEAAWGSLVTSRGELGEILGSNYRGTEDGFATVVVEATLEDGPQEFVVNFEEGDDEVAGFFIPEMAEWTAPSYADEDAFVEEEVTLEAPGDCSLGATLSVPEGDGPAPGVVIVHGSGPVDRDATVGPNRTYKELAWGLATQGVAVLRYDKRTFACDVDLANATIDDVTTDDALAAIERLREHERVDPDSVFVAGHSFGGTLAPRIADRDGSLAGIAMLAPAARPIADMIVDQQRHLHSLDGELTDADEEALEAVEEMAERIRTLDIDDDEVVNRLGGREYYETLDAYDHTGTAAALDVPLLVCQGGRDWQVTVEDDLPIWEDALADEPDVDFEVYEDLNHRFQESEGPMTAEEYREPDSPLAKTVVDDVAAFVDANADAS